MVVFRDKHPAALEHLQAVPRLHITNLDSLQPSAEDYALGKSHRLRWRLPLPAASCCIVSLRLQSIRVSSSCSGGAVAEGRAGA